MKKHRALLCLIAAVASAGLVAPAPALAAVHCDGSGCNGKKISDTDCMAQAYITASVQIKNGSTVYSNLDLYYSPSCHAMWGDYNAVSAETFATVTLETQPEYGGVNVVRFDANLRGGGNITTTMTDWQQSVRLCANGGISACTGWK